MYVCNHVCMYIPGCMHAYIQTHIHTYKQYIHTYIHTNTHTYTHTHTYIFTHKLTHPLPSLAYKHNILPHKQRDKSAWDDPEIEAAFHAHLRAIEAQKNKADTPSDLNTAPKSSSVPAKNSKTRAEDKTGQSSKTDKDRHDSSEDDDWERGVIAPLGKMDPNFEAFR